uniref:Peptidase C1A papain C-terminal domain-containing protein n=1 Tax=Ditylenchus dipsaci TaxID=166011 RepID=A0A915EQP9_9BILA
MNNKTTRICLGFGAFLSLLTLGLLFGLILYIFFSNPAHLDEDTASNASNSSEAEFEAKRNSLRLVEWLNDNPYATYTARLNPWAIGLTPQDEMDASMHPQNDKVMNQKLIELDNVVTNFYPIYDEHLKMLEQQQRPIPDHFNAAIRWPNCSKGILEVRNQGGCGSCWALSAVGVMTDRICIASKAELKVNISPQHLVECCSYCGGCNGTWDPLLPFLFWYETGLVSEECYPSTVSTDCGHPCRPETFFPTKGVHKCSETCTANTNTTTHHYNKQKAKYAYKLGSMMSSRDGTSLYDRYEKFANQSTKGPRNVEELIKRDMMMFGPSVLCFNVFESFMHYHEGIYNFVRGGPEEIHVYDHCVKLIGWGRYKNNSTDEMDRYFTAINSWSTKWAKDGTFKIDMKMLENYRSDFLPVFHPFHT